MAESRITTWTEKTVLDGTEVMNLDDGAHKKVTAATLRKYHAMFYDVTDYGATGNGSTDDSTAVTAAITAAKAAGGGTVFFPAGVYVMEGIGLSDGVHILGAGVGNPAVSQTGTVFELPASPSAHMFLWDGETTGYGGSVRNVYANGGQSVSSASYDFINASGATTELWEFFIENNVIDGFRAGYYGSASDREVKIGGNLIRNNTYGVYIIKDHPRFIAQNVWRGNRYGITGTGAGYDLFIENQIFAYCRYAIRPQSGDFNGWKISNNFFFDSRIAVQVGSDSVVSGNQFVASQRYDVAAVTAGATTTIRTSTSHGFATGDIIVLRNIFDTAETPNNHVDGLVFTPLSITVVDADEFTVPVNTTGITFDITNALAFDSLAGVEVMKNSTNVTISGNFFRKEGADRQFGYADIVTSDIADPGYLSYSNISGNTHSAEGFAAIANYGNASTYALETTIIANNVVHDYEQFISGANYARARVDRGSMVGNLIATDVACPHNKAYFYISNAYGLTITGNVFRHSSAITGTSTSRAVFDVDNHGTNSSVIFQMNYARIDASQMIGAYTLDAAGQGEIGFSAGTDTATTLAANAKTSF
ncbi:MAG: hypothetical protein GY800_13705 [Planctomycetes bacterium]|nr:hypothetical protein [Planctomycetota bacterium]